MGRTKSTLFLFFVTSSLTFNNTTNTHSLTATKRLKLHIEYFYRTAKMSLTKKLAITDVDLKDKRVLIRVSNAERAS